jgi:hypothetical protein
MRKRFPRAIDPKRVGKYPALTKSGAGYVWDAVLEYRVWCHPERGAPDLHEGSDYHFAFSNYPKALLFSKKHKGTEAPLALILQREHIDEPSPGKFKHIKQRRVTEWKVEWLSGSRRNKNTIPKFLSSSAPPKRPRRKPYRRK